MEEKKITIKEAINFGWETIKNNFAFIFIVAIIFLLISIVSQMFGNMAKGNFLFTVIVKAAFFVIDAIITIGAIKIALKFCDGQKPAFEDLYSSYPLALNYIGALLLFVIVCGLGLVLLIIPGIILLLRLQFYAYFVVDKNKGPIKALEASWEATKGNELNLLALWFTFLGIMLLGLLALFVGILVAIPIMMLALAFVYRRLSASAPAAQAAVGLQAAKEARPQAAIAQQAVTARQAKTEGPKTVTISIEKKTLVLIILLGALAIAMWTNIIGPFIGKVMNGIEKTKQKKEEAAKLDEYRKHSEETKKFMDETDEWLAKEKKWLEEMDKKSGAYPDQGSSADEDLFRKAASNIESNCKNKGVQFENMGIDGSSVIVIYRDPTERKLDKEFGIVLIETLVAIDNTGLTKSIDKIVILPRYNDGNTFKVSISVANAYRAARGEITNEQLQGLLKIEPYTE